jgi:hypothetical protein
MFKHIEDRILSFLLTAFLLALLTTSCESLKKDPDYVGAWQFPQQITSDNIVYNTTRTLTLTKDTYEETYVVQRENSSIISAIIGTGGSLGLTHTNLVFTLEKLGTCELDESEVCAGNVQWYGEGTLYWIENKPYFEEKVAGEYEVDGTTLWLTRDLNNDGDIEDTGENVTFEIL